MIELIHQDRCVDCDICVEVCPTDVFDRVPQGHPVIARQSDCQTCFMCEAHCPVDALFVSPLALPAGPDSPLTDQERLEADDRFGEYRRWLGWGNGRKPGSLRDRNQIFTTRMARQQRERESGEQDADARGEQAS